MNDQHSSKVIPVILKILLYLVTLIASIVILAFGALLIAFRGPSENATKLISLSLNETSALKSIPKFFLPKEDYNNIFNSDSSEDDSVSEIDDNGLYHIKINDESDNSAQINAPLSGSSVITEDGMLATINIDSNGNNIDLINNEAGVFNMEIPDNSDVPTYELIDIKKGSFKGKMLLVHDPSKVEVASIPSFGGVGWTLGKFCEEYDALACLNAGGFEDEDGKGKGGIPDGVVIRDGNIVYGSAGSSYKDVVGFDANHVLHVGNMSGSQALSCGIIDGMSFSLGPVLIQDGVRQSGFNSGVNPRSAIGQTADGTVILLAIEGRMFDSLGATFEDVSDLMEEYGAVNAANLDGGSSSGLYYEGERITRSCSVIGDRPLPTAIIVYK